MRGLAKRVAGWFSKHRDPILRGLFVGLFVAFVGGLAVVIATKYLFPPPITPSPTPPPPAQVVIDPRCCKFDAEGDDNKNKNGEWVCFTNQGGQEADMTGWVVMDEIGYSTGRAEYQYRFRSFVLSPGSTVLLYTGCGTDTANELYKDKKDAYAWWNNKGDTVYLFDEVGRLVLEYSHQPEESKIPALVFGK